jgi:hypothetical protein
MNKGKNLILNSDKISITGNEKTYRDLDDNSKKDPKPDVPSKKDNELIKARNSSSPKTCVEIINMG